MRCFTHRLKPLQCGLIIVTFRCPFVKNFFLIFLTFFQVLQDPISIAGATVFLSGPFPFRLVRRQGPEKYFEIF